MIWNPFHMQIWEEVEIVFPQSYKKILALLVHGTHLEEAKVCNHLHHPLAFLMPWCSFSFEFKERKKVCERITKRAIRIIPKVTILSVWKFVTEIPIDLHGISTNRTLNFPQLTISNKILYSISCSESPPPGTHKVPPPFLPFNTKTLIPNGALHPKEHFSFFWKLIAPLCIYLFSFTQDSSAILVCYVTWVTSTS